MHTHTRLLQQCSYHLLNMLRVHSVGEAIIGKKLETQTSQIKPTELKWVHAWARETGRERVQFGDGLRKMLTSLGL